MKLDEKEEKFVSRLKRYTPVWSWIFDGVIACAWLYLAWRGVKDTKCGIALVALDFGSFILVAVYVLILTFGLLLMSIRIKKLLGIIEKLKAPEPNTSPGRGAAASLSVEPHAAAVKK